MRKVSLLIAALLLVSVGAFAQTVDSTVEAEVSAAFGVQLDEMTTGISNSFSVDWEWVLREEATEEFGEGQMYGYIMVEDLEVSIAADGVNDLSGESGGGGQLVDFSWGDVEGRLVLGAAYIELGIDNITSSVDEASNPVKIDQSIVGLGRILGQLSVTSAVAREYTSEHPGVAVGFEVPEMATVELGAISMYDWEQDDAASLVTIEQYEAAVATVNDPTASPAAVTRANAVITAFTSQAPVAAVADTNDTNAYMLSLDAEITPIDMLTLNLVSTMEFGMTARVAEGKDATPSSNGNPVGIGVGVEYDMPFSADINLIPSFGYDIVMMEDQNEDLENRMQVSAGVNFVWPGLGLDEDEDDHIGFIGNADDEEEVTSGVGLGVVYGIHSWDFLNAADPTATGEVDESLSTLEVTLGFFEDGGDAGLFPVVGGAFMLNYNTILKQEDLGLDDPYSELGLGVEVNADLGVVAPYFGVKYVAEDLGGKYLNPTGTKVETDNFAAINLGTDINVIENVTFNIDYKSGNLLHDKDEIANTTTGALFGDPTYGAVYGPANSSAAKAGEFVIETTISY